MLPPPVALVLANGTLEPAALVARRLEDVRPEWVVAADGGARHARSLGLRLSAVVGDFDSLDPEASARAEAEGARLIRRPAAKDETDLELALLHAFSHGAGSAIVVGATGGRLDMSLANVMLLLHPDLRRRPIELWAGRQTARLLTPPGGILPGEAGDRISLIPLESDATGITSHGLEFSLTDETLRLGPARGVSNRIVLPPGRVELRHGSLLVVHTPAGADE